MVRLPMTLGAAALAVGLAAPAALAQEMTLEDLQRIALERNPTLVQVDGRLRAAMADSDQAGLWPNVHVAYATETVNGHESHGVFFRQTLPISGIIGASRRVHDRDADLARALVQEQQMKVATSVRLLYREALMAEHHIALQEEVVEHLEEVLVTIKQLMNVGLEDPTDVLETEIKIQHARLDLSEERLEQRHIWTELAQMVGDPSLTMQPLAGDALELPPELDYDTELDRMLTNSPELEKVRMDIARGEAAVGFERTETRPDLGVTLGRRYNRGLIGFGHETEVLPSWELALELDLSAPIWNRNQHGIRAAEEDVRMARADLDREILHLRSKFADEFHEYQIERDEARVYREEILPRAEQVHELALGRYMDFGEDYGEVLEAKGHILEVRGEILHSLSEAWHHTVMIEGMLLHGGLLVPEFEILENTGMGSADTPYTR